MNEVTTGTCRRRASSATRASIRKRRTSTPTIITGRDGVLDALHDLVGAGGYRLGIELRLRQALHGLARLEYPVARQLEVDGPRLLEAAAQHAGDLLRRLPGIVEQRLVAGDLAINRELRIEALDLVVQQQPAPALRCGPARRR